MALTAKLASTVRNRAANEGNDTAGSGFPTAQVFRGQGNFEPKFQSGGPTEKVVYCASWDDSIDGHIPAAGSIGLGVFIPKGFVVTKVYFDVEVVPVGPTNMGISLENDFDLSASAAISGAPWSTAGIKHGAQVDGGAVEVASTVQGPLTTTLREIALVGTVAASSAGRVVIWVEGVQRPLLLTQGAALA